MPARRTVRCLVLAAAVLPLSMGAEPALSQTASAAAGATTPHDVTADPRVAEALHLLDLWVEARRDWDRIPSVVVGVVHDQTLVWAKGYGYAHVAARAPASPSTIYSICSISKLFTGISVMQLRDRGVLSLADPVTKHLPWFDQRWPDAQAPPVTIEGLLTHSAGLAREPICRTGRTHPRRRWSRSRRAITRSPRATNCCAWCRAGRCCSPRRRGTSTRTWG